MKPGQAWLLKKDDGFYLKVVFSRTVGIVEPDEKAMAVDINENNVIFGSEECISIVRTGERVIRTAYSLKRRRLQSRLRLNEKPLLAKYRDRERRRIEDIYHKVANEMIVVAKKTGTSVVLENLRNIRRKKRSRALNGRLNRRSFRRFQSILEYKAKLAGMNVVYVDAKLLVDIVHCLADKATILPDKIIEPANAIMDECPCED